MRERGEVFIPTVAANARRRRRESSPEHYTSIPRPRRADRITPLCTDNDFTIPSHTAARISRGICGIKPEFSPGFTPKKKLNKGEVGFDHREGEVNARRLREGREASSISVIRL